MVREDQLSQKGRKLIELLLDVFGNMKEANKSHVG